MARCLRVPLASSSLIAPSASMSAPEGARASAAVSTSRPESSPFCASAAASRRVGAIRFAVIVIGCIDR